MTREPDIAMHEEGAPHGAPDPARPHEKNAVAAGDPEAPVGPVRSVKSVSVDAPPDGNPPPDGSPPSDGNPLPDGTLAATEDHAATEDAAAQTDHERRLEHDLEQLTAKAAKAEEYLELAQRTRADFENYRKRAAREAAAAQERGITKLAKELLPAVDNLDRALEAAQSTVAADGSTGQTAQDNGTTTLIDGIKLVHEEVINALARAGIERFSPEGERFDPQMHEAIAQQPVAGKESGTVVEVYQRGYRLGETVIRPARVVVAA